MSYIFSLLFSHFEHFYQCLTKTSEITMLTFDTILLNLNVNINIKSKWQNLNLNLNNKFLSKC